MKSNLNINFDICNQIKQTAYNYVIALLFTASLKNCSSMSRETGISSRILSKTLASSTEIVPLMKEFLINEAKKLYAEDPDATLVIDFTQLEKNYAFKIEKLTYDHNGCSSRVEKGISIGLVALVGKNKIIPLDFSYWIQKKYAQDQYIKKNKLAELLIIEIKKVISFKNAAFDGAFASEEILAFLIKEDIKFTMRMPANRRIKVANGQSFQIRDTPELHLLRNQRHKKIKASYKGMVLDFVAHKRQGKNNEMEVVYLVGNIDISAKEYIDLYKKRAVIEALFRTLKQKLGIKECQMLGADKQTAHIFATFVAFVITQQNKIDNQQKCPEDIINYIRAKDSPVKSENYLNMTCHS